MASKQLRFIKTILVPRRDILLMEAAFGLPGITVAPVFYTYVKAELMRHELV